MTRIALVLAALAPGTMAAQSVVAGLDLGVVRYARSAPGDTAIASGPLVGIAAQATGGALVARLGYATGRLDDTRTIRAGVFAVGWTVVPPVTVLVGTRSVRELRGNVERSWSVWHLAGETTLPLAPLPAAGHARLELAPAGRVTGGDVALAWSFAAGLSARPFPFPLSLTLDYQIDRLAATGGALTDALERVTLGGRWDFRQGL